MTNQQPSSRVRRHLESSHAGRPGDGGPSVIPRGIEVRYEGDKMVWGEGLVECYEGDKMVVLFDAVGYKALAVDVVTQNGLLQAAGGR